MSSSIWEMGHLLAMRSSVCVSQASGSTLFIFAVCRRVAMVAHVLPPGTVQDQNGVPDDGDLQSPTAARDPDTLTNGG